MSAAIGSEVSFSHNRPPRCIAEHLIVRPSSAMTETGAGVSNVMGVIESVSATSAMASSQSSCLSGEPSGDRVDEQTFGPDLGFLRPGGIGGLAERSRLLAVVCRLPPSRPGPRRSQAEQGQAPKPRRGVGERQDAGEAVLALIKSQSGVKTAEIARRRTPRAQ
jgi:hypothetical protein